MDINQTLPIYLQRNVIIKLCIYINDCIKNKDLLKQEEHNEIIIETKKLVLLLSMVNKEWFKTVSNNLNVIEFDDLERTFMEYNGNRSEYSILKIENCKYLKITPWDTTITSKLAEKLLNGSFISLKRLILQESEGKVNQNRVIEFLGELKDNKVTNEIYLNSLLLYSELNIGEPFINNLIKSNVKKVITVKIYQYENELALLKTFSTWSNSIKKIVYVGPKIYTYNAFQALSSRVETGNINYLENIESISISITNRLSFDTTISALKSATNLKELSLTLCFRTLIYNLATKEERKSLNITKCPGCSFSNDIQQYHQAFVSVRWSILRELFKTNTTLQHLSLNCTCTKFEIKCQKLENEISNLVSSISSLDKFSLKSTNYPEIFKSIVEKNKSISKFHSVIYNIATQFTNDDLKLKYEQIDYSISIFNDLIQSNPHITQFKFENYTNETENKNLINFKNKKN